MKGQSLWPLRLLSLAIAVTLWLLYSFNSSNPILSERAFEDAAVTYNVPQGLLVLNPPRTVAVRLAGPQEAIGNLNPFQVSLSIDVPSDVGLHEITLEEPMVNRPPGFEVKSLTPGRLSLQVDQEIEKALVVRLSAVGEPPAGARWVNDESFATPKMITVRGPNSLLETRDSITAIIDLERRVTSHEQTVPVQPIHELVQPVGQSIVRVFVKMEAPQLPSSGR
jgi:hypothetical protein